jgi:hypothetical protein
MSSAAAERPYAAHVRRVGHAWAHRSTAFLARI